MKTMMIILLLGNMAFAQGKIKTTTVTVKGMVCSFCAQGIEKKLKTFKEVQSVNVDLDTKKVVVQATDDKILTQDVLKKTIKDAGYDVVDITVGPQ